MESVNCKLKDIEENLKRLAFHYEKIITYYMRKGWFWDFEIPVDSRTLEIFYNEPAIFENFMKDYFNNKVEDIDQIVKDRFPERHKIISKALFCHKNMDYELSIPIIIGQVDGIFRDITGKDMFSSRDNRAEKVFEKFKKRNTNNKMLSAALTPLKEYRMLTLSFNKVKDYPHIVSRNSILHGYDINYASETNGLKTISLLNYVVRVVYDILHSDNFLLNIKLTS